MERFKVIKNSRINCLNMTPNKLNGSPNDLLYVYTTLKLSL